ncbi:hypothetical protein V6N13_118036 [Hibiscus sabdariffa]|uniref:Uncharacterized protein n=1 Tax=Hibiscus sabdariffa TaxID=183260 RepID=A0ABR2Q8Z3_9ROSI
MARGKKSSPQQPQETCAYIQVQDPTIDCNIQYLVDEFSEDDEIDVLVESGDHPILVEGDPGGSTGTHASQSVGQSLIVSSVGCREL